MDFVDFDAILEDHNSSHVVEWGSDDSKNYHPSFKSSRVNAGEVQFNFSSAMLSLDVLEKYTVVVDKL